MKTPKIREGVGLSGRQEGGMDSARQNLLVGRREPTMNTSFPEE